MITIGNVFITTKHFNSVKLLLYLFYLKLILNEKSPGAAILESKAEPSGLHLVALSLKQQQTAALCAEEPLHVEADYVGGVGF